MKRRSFLQAVGGAIAAVFAPTIAAKLEDDYFDTLDAKFRVRYRSAIPETVAELRAAIESRYETVHEFKEAPYEEGLLGYGIGRAPTAQPPGYTGPFYRRVMIAGEGASEKEAVADAFRHIGVAIGGREMMWRKKLVLGRERDFESNCITYRVRGRVLVLR